MIRMLKAWNGYPQQAIVSLSGSEETRLVGLGLASFDIDGEADAEFLVKAKTNPLTGGIREAVNGAKVSILRLNASGDTYGAKDTANITACLRELETEKDGILLLGDGAWYAADTTELFGGYSGALGAFGTTIRGMGMGSTRINMLTPGKPLFQKSSGVAHNLENLFLYGPGTGNQESLAMFWNGAAGGAMWQNVWVQNFGDALRFYDATAMTFLNLNCHANGRNLAIGYNCDIFEFIGGRQQNATDTAVYIGWRDAGHAAGSLQCNAIKFRGTRFGANPVVFDIPDYGASQIGVDNGYFENNAKIAWLGDAAQASGPKGFHIENSMFTVVSNNTQIETRQANQESSITLKNNRSDTAAPTCTWVSMGLNSRLHWEENDLPGTAHCAWNGSSYVFDKKQSYEVNVSRKQIIDGSVAGSIIPVDVVETNGTGKTFAKFRRINATTGADLGILSAQIRDVNGQMAVFGGAVMLDQPSSALPAASATYRGITVIQQGGAGVADTVVCCMKSSADTYSWKTVATG